MNIDKKVEEFNEKFVQQPLKEGGTFGWSKQDCGGAEMVENFIRQALTDQKKEIIEWSRKKRKYCYSYKFTIITKPLIDL